MDISEPCAVHNVHHWAGLVGGGQGGDEGRHSRFCKKIDIKIKSLIIFLQNNLLSTKNAAKQSVQRSKENIEKFNPAIF